MASGQPVDSIQLVDSLSKELQGHSDPVFRARLSQYLHQDITRCLGVRTPIVRRISAKYFEEIRSLGVDDVVKLCERLLETGLSEHRIIAFDWSFRCRRSYQPKHFAPFERWLRTYADGWASCDDLCCHALGDIVMRYPQFLPRARQWTLEPNRWQRRGAAVTLIYGARRGKNLEHVFDVADALLTDTDDVAQKGYGWMLKVASRTYPEEVFEYLMRNRAAMPRTALRYAVEKLPEQHQRQVMSEA